MFLFLVGAAGGTVSLHAAVPETTARCARTPEIAALQGPGEAPAAEAQRGFRLVGLHSDPLRGRVWAVVGSCEDASKPLIAVPVAAHTPAVPKPERDGSAAGVPVEVQVGGGSGQTGSASLVHAGDRLRVVSASGDSQMELEGSAEEPGQAGSAVRVRLARLGGEGEPPRVLHCRVLAAGLVEVLP